MTGLPEVSHEGTPRLTWSKGEGEGIFEQCDCECPRDSELEIREELSVLGGPPARLEE